jgi:hypothetical protein
VSLGFRTAVSTFGGLASLIATWLIAVTGGKLSPSLLPDRHGGAQPGALTVIQRRSRCATPVVSAASKA